MKNEILSQKLKTMRSLRNMTQKDFAAYIGIPQPTLSAYENGKNNPTVDVLIEIADKCGVSLDWLCGRETNAGAISSMSDVAQFFYDLGEFNEISFEIDTERHENSVTLTFNGDDKAHVFNADICNILREISNNRFDLETYSISKDQYESFKKNSMTYYKAPLSKKIYEELSREEQIKRRIEALNKMQNNI